MTRPPRRASARPSKSSGGSADSPKGLKIGDAAKVVGVKAFVLRFWETEFPFLKAGHARFKHRVYAPEDIENLKLVKRLLHDERFTIEGAKKHLRQFGLERVRAEMSAGADRPSKSAVASTPPEADPKLRNKLADIRRELVDLQKRLKH